MSQAGELNLASAPGVTDFIEGNMGGPVGPNGANVIFLLGTGDISVTGNPWHQHSHHKRDGPSHMEQDLYLAASIANMGYICTSGGVLALSLPATSQVGDIIEVTLDGLFWMVDHSRRWPDYCNWKYSDDGRSRGKS